jgi:hypothetical protein
MRAPEVEESGRCRVLEFVPDDTVVGGVILYGDEFRGFTFQVGGLR